MARPDLIEAMLPEASDAVLERARRVTTYLRLLTDDARPRRPSPVSISVERAAGEYASHARQRLQRAILELARRHLRAALGPESFVDLEAPAGDVEAEDPWTALVAARREPPDGVVVPAVPAPGESSLEVARRLVEALARIDESAARLAGAWLARAADGPEAGERAFAELLRAASGRLARRARRGRIECLLDRGAVGRAATELERLSEEDLGADERLRWLDVWVRLFLGDEDGARRRAGDRRPYPGVVPAAIVELRERRPDWLRLLAGRARTQASGAPAEPTARREDFGATFFGVFSFDPECGAAPVSVDVAPGSREGLDDHLFQRADAHASPCELEHLVVVDAEVRVAHRGDETERALRSCLDPERTRAACVAPILDDEREVIGWLRLEASHHLLPDRRRLERLAAAWRPVVAPRAAAAHAPELRPRSGGASVCAETFRRWVAELSMKTSQRRWWGFVPSDGDVVEVATGGGALDGDELGGRRALGRAIASRGTVVFAERSPALSVSARAASGVVVPLVLHERVVGVFAVESARRRDFRTLDVERIAGAAGRFAPVLRLAEFRDWHAARFGTDVVLDCDDTPFGRRALDFVAAGRARSAVAITGPPGSGKEVVARWLHFEGSDPEAPLTVLPAGAAVAWPERLTRALAAVAEEPGTLLIDDATALESSAQLALLATLLEAERRPASEAARGRIVLTAACALERAIDEGLVLPELGRRLQRLELTVPPLKRRREELPRLVEVLARRFSEEEGLAAPRFPDETLALLWRQEWPGNVRELGHWIYKLTLLHAGRSVTPAALGEFAERFGLKLVRRLPSRHPDREDLRAALRTTLTGRGTLNKTRASAYLGWDPDTLVARLRDCGWPDDFPIGSEAGDG